VVIEDHDDSVSANWTAVMEKRGFPVVRIQYGTLWRMAWSGDTPRPKVEEMAMAVSVSRSREQGLLGNPVSQRITLLQKGT
jgi:hypothetical protein